MEGGGHVDLEVFENRPRSDSSDHCRRVIMRSSLGDRGAAKHDDGRLELFRTSRYGNPRWYAGFSQQLLESGISSGVESGLGRLSAFSGSGISFSPLGSSYLRRSVPRVL